MAPLVPTFVKSYHFFCAVSNVSRASFSIAAWFSKVAVLAAVLALVVIFILSIIILIAVWRKVRHAWIHLFQSNYSEYTFFKENIVKIIQDMWDFPPSLTFLSETSLWNQMEGDRVCEPGWTWVHLCGPHPSALWPGLGDAQRKPGAGWVLPAALHLLKHWRCTDELILIIIRHGGTPPVS